MRTTLLALALLLAAGCPSSSGPCSSPEVLFPSPAANSTTTDGGVVIDVTWQPTSAPAAFYASPRATGDVRILDAGVTGARLTSTSSSRGTLAFELRYSEGPTRCSHPGMDDTFVLSVSVPLLTDGGVAAGSVATSTELGAL